MFNPHCSGNLNRSLISILIEQCWNHLVPLFSYPGFQKEAFALSQSKEISFLLYIDERKELDRKLVQQVQQKDLKRIKVLKL